MNLKLENLLLLLAVVTDLTRTVSSFDSKCPPLRLVNGRSRYRWRGRSVRFNCMRGFQLVGVKYATCMNGKWDTKVPICVRYGCHAPSTNHVNGQFIESYRGAVVRIVCNPGYTLVGSPTVYCNGVRWNETFPVCVVKNTNPALSCDFESPDLCGWSQDPMHDFDWRRQNGSTPSGDAGTGPTFDHTFGENGTGHYMYLESSGPRMKNDTARLYSPVYPPDYSNGTCFRFWYHMYGSSAGLLKVYVKPEGEELFSVIPSFWVNGEQGKSWMEGFFQIDPMETPFQIVIEGVLSGSGSAGDTAFDDVRLTSSDECKILEEMTSSTEYSSSVNPDDDSMDYFSCKNRCGQEKTNATAIDPDNDRCNCYDSCDRDGSCCSDYFYVCSPFPSTAPTTAQTDVKSSTSISPSSSTVPSVEPEPEQPSPIIPSRPPSPKPPTPKPPSVKPPTPKPSPEIHYNNESNEIEPRRHMEQIPPETNRTLNQIPRGEFSTTRRSTPRTTTPQPEVKPRNGTDGRKPPPRKVAKVVEGKTSKPGTNRTKGNETPEKAKVQSWNEGKKKEVLPKVEGQPDVGKSTAVTSPVTTTTARVFRNPKPNNIQFQKTFLEKPSNTNLSNEFRFSKGKSKEVSGKELPQAIKIDKPEETGGGTVRGIVEMGSAVLAVLVIIVLGVFFYKRREYRKAERENMVEDSDSIVCKMDSSTLPGESVSLVCIRPGGLQETL